MWARWIEYASLVLEARTIKQSQMRLCGEHHRQSSAELYEDLMHFGALRMVRTYSRRFPVTFKVAPGQFDALHARVFVDFKIAECCC